LSLWFRIERAKRAAVLSPPDLAGWPKNSGVELLLNGRVLPLCPLLAVYLSSILAELVDLDFFGRRMASAARPDVLRI
jgi:hypothetical protein